MDAAGNAAFKLAPEEPVQRRRSPRITVVRLLSSIVPLGLCIAKALSVAEGQSALPNTLYWIIMGVIWGLVAYWLNVIEMEETYPEWAECLFEQDLTSLMEFWHVLSFIPRIMWWFLYFTASVAVKEWGAWITNSFASGSRANLRHVGFCTPRQAFRFGFWAISWISTYAGWPNNLKYTPRIQSTIEYMRAVPPYKRWAIKIIEIFSGSAAVHYYYGSVIFKNSSLFRGGHWGNVKLAAAVAALLTFTSTPFFLFAFYMSARGNVR